MARLNRALPTALLGAIGFLIWFGARPSPRPGRSHRPTALAQRSALGEPIDDFDAERQSHRLFALDRHWRSVERVVDYPVVVVCQAAPWRPWPVVRRLKLPLSESDPALAA
jgi:hypothetical protein